MSKPNHYHPWLHRLAVLTCCVALLPIVVGAMVTTLDAGMAFPDWPSSDGQGMFSYPWLQSAGDEFIEHGHRLAGIVIGIVSILLVAVTWWLDQRRSARVLSLLVLFGVVGQGLLGGVRVLWNDDRFAMVHGSFASWVFSLMAVVALVTSRSWIERSVERADKDRGRDRSLDGLKPLAILTPLAIVGQYAIGGLVRHLSTGLHEHIGGAVVVSVFCLATVWTGFRSRSPWLKRPAAMILLFLFIQVSLGIGAWVTRFGFASTGYVAVQGALPQVVIRTAHTVVGMMLLMSTVVYAVRLFRLSALQQAGIREGQPTRAAGSQAGLIRVPVGGGVS